MKVTVIPIEIRMVQGLKNLEIRGRVETIYTTEYWGESWRLEETYFHPNFSEKPSANDGVENSQRSK